MKSKYLLAIDQGTTGTTALLVTTEGHIRKKAPEFDSSICVNIMITDT